MPLTNASASRNAQRCDKIARWIITLGGVTVIASVVAILAMIVGVTLPLFRSPEAYSTGDVQLPPTIPRNQVVGLGVDMAMKEADVTAFLWTSDGMVTMLDAQTGRVRTRERLKRPKADPKDELCSAESLNNGKYSLVWSSGDAMLVEIVSKAANTRERASAAASTAKDCFFLRLLAEIPNAEKQRFRNVFIRRSEAGAVTRAALLADGRISILRQTTKENALGEEENVVHTSDFHEEYAADIRAIAMDREGNVLYAGTSDGRLIRWQLSEEGEVAQREVVRAFADRRSITALGMALGETSLIVGDEQGEVTAWFPVQADATRKLRLVHHFERHPDAVRQIVSSGRNKTLVTQGVQGEVFFDYLTSERHLLSVIPENSNLSHMALGPRGDILATIDAGGELRTWQISGGYPEISLQTLFGKVHYEGYDTPEFVWQTTGGEDFEPKFSLVPLLFGTLKGTFFAMIFAAPIALFGAAYVSYFTTPAFRNVIKPTVEIMATVPSVVIGFIIALWLAPILERRLLVFFLGLVTLPAAFAIFMLLWQQLRYFDRIRRMENGYEFIAILPALLVGCALAYYLAEPFESLCFGGNFRQWLFHGPLAMRYDQRNNIIIAFGLGFTVIPIIFSIAEDSLSNVPYNMTSASMALGASRWQTLWNVVLPSASPGIFAAMMIGFGRAVGETMIVLMATGNTPILDWSPFDGMRTLSANIAVEIPEAPVGGTLYRVLFLCAVLLFVLTFLVNTAAELVRQHLRKRFGRFT